MSSGRDMLDRAEGLSPAEATEQGISGAVLAIFGGIIVMIETMFAGISNIIGRLSDVGDLITAFFQNPIIILEETARHTAFVLTEGDWAFFGPGTFAVGILSIALGYWVWTALDPDIPFLGTLMFWRRG